MKHIKNISASVRQQLLKQSRQDKRPFSELLQYYAMERFLFRLSNSIHAKQFILKGAYLLKIWKVSEFRGTMDIDLLGRASNELTTIINQIQEILEVDVADDGISFYSDSIQVERIAEDADYHGVRVRFIGILDTAKIYMQIDIGFDDVIHPSPKLLELPVLLDFPVPRLLCYSRESVIAEKFQAIVKLGAINSRMKDFYDIWHLCRQFNFEGQKLANAIRLTFQKRGTSISTKIYAFEESFIVDKQKLWSAFCNRLAQEHLPESFEEIILVIKTFLVPIITKLSQNESISLSWQACGPWV
ncbi:MAG: nucleotidyl transferase AbiEii/AbiGii toxin family protein [Bacteroidales bacterium]|jgi:predicted nucleotidyltransferase component of viral defense system|nr:nucleotidyl transferase AbiEii/AbiGii toxin family protein [Bacteroidales bacterium]